MPPEVSPYMPRIRELLLQGRADETCALIDEAQKKAGFDKYMNFDNENLYPVGSPRQHTAFWLTFHQSEQPDTKDYLRWLDMQNGKITTVWTDRRGTFRSECVAAYEGDLAVNRFTAPKGRLDIEIGIMLPDHPVRYGYLILKMPFESCLHELSVTDQMITLAWVYNPDYGHISLLSGNADAYFGGRTSAIPVSVPTRFSITINLFPLMLHPKCGCFFMLS